MTVDTNIVIAHLAGDKDVADELFRIKKLGIPLILPTVVEMETLSYPLLTEREILSIRTYLQETYTSIPLDPSIAFLGAKLRRTYNISFADAAIAATALTTRTSLITRNVKDFKKVTDLTIITF